MLVLMFTRVTLIRMCSIPSQSGCFSLLFLICKQEAAVLRTPWARHLHAPWTCLFFSRQSFCMDGLPGYPEEPRRALKAALRGLPSAL